MKVSVAQIAVVPGRPDLNTPKILDYIQKAILAGDDLIVFPEMAVPGYLLGDEWENNAFINDCLSYNQEIISASRNIVVVWGNVDANRHLRNEDGRWRKYNAAFVAQNGQPVGTGKTYKTLLPKYREFEDERHFYSLRKLAQDQQVSVSDLIKPFEVTIRDTSYLIGVMLCEDMWSDDYTINPIKILVDQKPDLLINISCSPWTWRKNNKRHSVVRERIKQYPVNFIYANNVGIQNNGKNIFLFDGNSTIYNPDGSLHKVAGDYMEENLRATLFDPVLSTLPAGAADKLQDLKELHFGLVYGLRKFFENFTTKKVVIGLSGGIDSALSAALLAEAVGPENVYAVNMPSVFNSQTTKGAALEVAQNLGIHFTTISIQQSFEHTVQQLESAEFVRQDVSKLTTPVLLSGLNKENMQARDRGSRLLAGVASALGALFINNGNKTETALGYATLYGDVNGALAPLADLYKGEVYALAKFINDTRRVIPETIFSIPASAELSTDQNVDEGKGDPIYYPYHDQLVRAFVEFRLDPEEILRFYNDGTLAQKFGLDEYIITGYFKTAESFIYDLEHKWRTFKISVFKRIQAPPIIAVSKRAFGFDLRESQNGAFFTKAYRQLKKDILDANTPEKSGNIKYN